MKGRLLPGSSRIEAGVIAVPKEKYEEDGE
jgi:hypothetical protein